MNLLPVLNKLQTENVDSLLPESEWHASCISHRCFPSPFSHGSRFVTSSVRAMKSTNADERS